MLGMGTSRTRRQIISLDEYEKLMRCSSHTDSTNHRARHHHRRQKHQNTTNKGGDSNHEQRLRDIFNQVEQLNDHVEQLLHKYCDDPSSSADVLQVPFLPSSSSPPTPPRPSKRKQPTIGGKQPHGCYHHRGHGMKKVILMAPSA